MQAPSFRHLRILLAIQEREPSMLVHQCATQTLHVSPYSGAHAAGCDKRATSYQKPARLLISSVLIAICLPGASILEAGASRKPGGSFPAVYKEPAFHSHTAAFPVFAFFSGEPAFRKWWNRDAVFMVLPLPLHDSRSLGRPPSAPVAFFFGAITASRGRKSSAQYASGDAKSSGCNYWHSQLSGSLTSAWLKRLLHGRAWYQDQMWS